MIIGGTSGLSRPIRACHIRVILGLYLGSIGIILELYWDYVRGLLGLY